jgi:TRAP transporter 4TM/12TM fusion protein
MVDLEAVKQGIRGVPSSDTLRRVWVALRDGGHLLIPVFVLLHQTVIIGTSMQRAGLYSCIAVVIVSWLRRSTRIGWTRLIEGLREGAMLSVGIAAVCASAGIIVGIVAMTGVGVKFGSVVVGLSQGNLFITLVLTAVICLFLGTGLPTTASYIITAAVGVPALLKLGADPIAAHLFVFYFAAISTITPPVAGAVYTACGFSGSPVMATGWTATRLGISGYVVPFLFVYHPVLLFKGGWLEITQATVTAIIGVAAVSMALIGSSYIGGMRWNTLQRALFFGAFFALMTPGTVTDLLGLAAIVVAVLTHPQPWQRLLRTVTGRRAEIAIAVEPRDGRA